MVTRWSRRAGCEWPEHLQSYAALDLDQFVPEPKPRHSGWNRGAPMESTSSFGWARAAAIHPTTAMPLWTFWWGGFWRRGERALRIADLGWGRVVGQK